MKTHRPRQACRADLLLVGRLLGIEFEGRPTVAEIMRTLREQLSLLHFSLNVLHPTQSAPTLGADACRSRLLAVHRAAQERRTI